MCNKNMGICALLICLNIICFFPLPAGAMNEKGIRETFRPDNLDRGQRKAPALNYVDAYGNSIFVEPEEKPREKRIGAGAYGGYDTPKTKEPRPLPDVPTKPKWSFK